MKCGYDALSRGSPIGTLDGVVEDYLTEGFLSMPSLGMVREELFKKFVVYVKRRDSAPGRR